ncbi:MAG: hypothetical protein K1X87_03740 [Dehalococcoidia bacterium]|nr:hypothetical protein [Dehalococcoidia bacterium]
MVRSLQHARVALAFIEPKLAEVVECAWHDYEMQYRQVRHIHRLGAQATVIHSLMVHHARRVLAGLPGVTFRDDGQLFIVSIRDEWVIKLRKFSAGLLVANNATQYALDFVEQAPGSVYQIELFSLDPPTHVHVGYRLNKTKTGIRSIHVVCPNGADGNYWDYELERSAAAGTPQVSRPLSPAAGGIAPASKRRVSPRQIPPDRSRVRPVAEKEARAKEQKEEQAGDSNEGDARTS